MRCKPSATSAADTSRTALDWPSDVRIACATTVPSDVSLVVAWNCATMTREFSSMRPALRSDAAGPIPKARIVMTAMSATATTPPASSPPRQVRFHDTTGAARSAIVAIVECTTVPPAVRVGVVSSARRAVCCTYQVKSTTGSPSPHTTSASGTVHSGSPMPITAARARTQVAANAASQMPIAFGSEICWVNAMPAAPLPDVLNAASRCASTSRADCGRSFGDFAMHAAISVSSVGFASGRRSRTWGAGALMWAAMSRCGSVSVNGRRPVRSSKARQP